MNHRRAALRHALTLAIIIGAGGGALIALWTSVTAVVGRTPPLGTSAMVRRVVLRAPGDSTSAPEHTFSYPVAAAFEASLDGAGFALGRPFLPVGVGHLKPMTLVAFTSPHALESLRPPMRAGRTYRADGVGPQQLECVVSDSLARQYGGDAPVGDAPVGTVLYVGTLPCRVVGVLSKRFAGLFPTTAPIWMPMTEATLAAIDPNRRSRGTAWLSLYIKADDSRELRATTARAERALADGFRTVEDRDVPMEAILKGLAVRDQPESVRQRLIAPALAALGLAVVFLLVATVASAGVARLTEQARGLAIRLALGAPRARFVGDAVRDSAVGVGLGIVLAVGVASGLTRLLADTLLLDRSLALAETRAYLAAVMVIGVGVLVLLATLVASVWHSTERLARDVGGRSAEHGIPRYIGVLALLSQAAISAGLTGFAVTAIRGSQKLAALDVGADIAHTLMADVTPESPVAGVGARADAMAAVVRILSSDPAVQRLATAQDDPLRSGSAIAPWSAEAPLESVLRPNEEAPYYTPVGAGYFTTIGARNLIGRDFVPSDDASAPRVAIINGNLARQLFPTGSPVGRCMYLDDDTQCVTVVGVLPGTWKLQALRRSVRAVYLPLAQASFVRFPGRGVSSVAFASVSEGHDLKAVRGRIESAIRTSEAPALNGFSVRVETLEEMLDPEFTSYATTTALLGSLAASAVALAWLSALAMAQRAVRSRRHELAVRCVLGASPWYAAVAATGRIAVALTAGGALAAVALWLVRQKVDGAFYEVSVGHASSMLAAAALPALMALGVVAQARATIRAIPLGELLRNG